MGELKATPGPWRVKPDDTLLREAGWIEVISSHGPMGETVVADIWEADLDQQGANAHLIAASHEMFEALEAIVNCWDGPLYKHQMLPNIEKARSAMKKARGES